VLFAQFNTEWLIVVTPMIGNLVVIIVMVMVVMIVMVFVMAIVQCAHEVL
jgi:uncharacterized membrane protein (DUF485 family)